MNNISNNKTNLNLSNQSKSNIDDKQWPVINAILTVTAEQKHNQELELKKQARLKYENDIKLQIELNQKKKEIEKQNELNQLKLLQENMNNYNKDINEMKKRKEDQLSMERMIKLQQIEEKKLEKERFIDLCEHIYYFINHIIHHIIYIYVHIILYCIYIINIYLLFIIIIIIVFI